MHTCQNIFCFLICLYLLTGCVGESVTSPASSSMEAAASPEGTATLFSTATPGADCISAYARRDSARVTRVVDGDSIEVEIGGVGFRVRYIGIDAPEMADEPLAEESRAHNAGFVAGGEVWLIRDRSETDTYGRLLRYVFAGGVFVNLEMIRSGMARTVYFPPDTSCSSALDSAQQAARRAQMGIWQFTDPLAGESGETPVSGICPQGCEAPPPGCLIKGNINAKGEKIYHLPGGQNYERTDIDPIRGERWFCTEEEAVQSGWRRAKT